MPVEDQLGAERCLLQEQHLTSGILVFQLQGLLDESSEARAGTASLSCGARGAAAPSLAGLGWAPELKSNYPRRGAALLPLSFLPSLHGNGGVLSPIWGKRKSKEIPLFLLLLLLLRLSPHF